MTITVCKRNGKHLTVKEAAKELGVNERTIRYYLNVRKAKDLEDISRIRAIRRPRIMVDKSGEPIRKHPTIYGKLSVREIFELHPHKDKITIGALYARIRSHGTEGKEIWFSPEQIKELSLETKTCLKCHEIKNKRRFYKNKTTFKHDNTCILCRRQAANSRNKKERKADKKKQIVYRGDLVVSDGKLYKVTQVIQIKRRKNEVTGHRVMPNGQVLTRTIKYLFTNWSLQV